MLKKETNHFMSPMYGDSLCNKLSFEVRLVAANATIKPSKIQIGVHSVAQGNGRVRSTLRDNTTANPKRRKNTNSALVRMLATVIGGEALPSNSPEAILDTHSGEPVLLLQLLKGQPGR